MAVNPAVGGEGGDRGLTGGAGMVVLMSATGSAARAEIPQQFANVPAAVNDKKARRSIAVPNGVLSDQIHVFWAVGGHPLKGARQPEGKP